MTTIWRLTAPASEPSVWSEWLFDVMAKRGLSNRDVARMAGISNSTVSRLVGTRREPKMSVLIAVSRALGVDLLDIR